MKTSVEDLGNNTVKVMVEVPPLEFERGLGKAYRKLAGSINIPGFRKGKAPRTVVDNALGKEAVLQEAAGIVIPDVYPRAIDESGIEPVSRPSVSVEQLEDGKDFIFSATVQVRPAIDLGDLSRIEIEEVASKPTDEEIDARLGQMRDRSAKLDVSKRSQVKSGDFVHFDFEGFVDGKPFQGGSATDYVLEIGSGSFIPGFEDQMVGLKRGGEEDIPVTFPETYGAAHLAGREARFRVKIKEIKEKKLPKLDDEFAKSVSEFETLAELRSDIAKNLEDRKAGQNKTLMRNALVDKVVEQAKLELPSQLVDSYREGIAEEFSDFLQGQQRDFEEYLKGLEDGGKALREQMNTDAEKRAKTNLVLSEIVRKEKIEITEDELDEEIHNMAARSNEEYEKLAAELSEDDRDYLRQRLEIAKAVDMLETRVKTVKKTKKAAGAAKKTTKKSAGKDVEKG